MTFGNIEDDIRPILKENIGARCDDMQLYAAYVYRKLDERGKDWLLKVFSDRRFRIIHGIAPYESVSRIRRKLQAMDATLLAPTEVTRERKEAEKRYKAYARD